MIASIELRRVRHRLRAIVALPQMARLCSASNVFVVKQRIIRLTELPECVILTGQLIESHSLEPFATYQV